jgi:hypothetical protein
MASRLAVIHFNYGHQVHAIVVENYMLHNVHTF